MITIGEGEISTLYLGDTKIKRAYLGDRLVFESEKISRLPEGYTELQSIKNPNFAAISNFGMTSTFMLSAKMELDVEFLENQGGTLIGTYLNDSSTGTINTYGNYITYDYKTKVVTIYYGYKDSSSYRVYHTEGQAIDGKNKIIVKVGTDSEFSINGVQYDISKREFSNSSYMVVPGLFGYNKRYKTKTNTTNYWVESNSRINCIFYSMKYYDNDNSLVAEYVPCRQESDGRIGIFEILSGKFYKNYDSAVFEAGPAV